MFHFERKGLRMRRDMQGVTMLELMIVVVIIGILTAIAYPNYRDFTARAKRVEAKAALLKIATNQERFYLQNNTYTTNMLALGFDADPFISDSDSYSIAIPAADASDYTAVATYRLGGREADKCGVFQIDGTGDKTFTGTSENCWTTGR
jgi:type IV pilus assembly protein PilE